MSSQHRRETLAVSAITPDQLTLYNPDNFLQQGFWARHKTAFGWQAHCLRLTLPQNAETELGLLVLERRLSLGFSFFYIPHAPGMDRLKQLLPQESLGPALRLIAKSLRPIAKGRLLFTRFDLDWVLESLAYKSEDEAPARFDGHKIRQDLNLAPLIRASADVQPPDTVLLDLSPGSESILATMRAKTRYNIRLAQKKGVVVSQVGLDQLDAWYQMYQVTAKRDQIAIHSRDYYYSLLESNPQTAKLYLAFHENDLLAGIITISAGKTATYLYGASSNVKRNLMPAYALQWLAISQSIENNCRAYDFGGVPSSNDPEHPMHGLFQFKTGFGGNLVAMPGAWDFPNKAFIYRVFRQVERLRNFYFKSLKKR